MLAGWARKISAETAAYPVPVYLGQPPENDCLENSVQPGPEDEEPEKRDREAEKQYLPIHPRCAFQNVHGGNRDEVTGILVG